MKFNQLGLTAELVTAIESQGYTEPTDIQAKVIPQVLNGKDILACSPTGSGKTLAFGAGILNTCTKWGGIQALILTPTRELALQVTTTLQKCAQPLSIHITELTGGVDLATQRQEIRSAHIIVGTPGRILDHLTTKSLSLTKLQYLVLDEADRMLEAGFNKEVHAILKACPTKRQTLLFSATLSKESKQIAKKYMHTPFHIKTETNVNPDQLYHTYYDVTHEQKFPLIVHLLKKTKGIVMIFCNTRRTVDRLTMNLNYYGLKSLAIHAGLEQVQRNEHLETFHKREISILVCSNVAARGLDILNVSHVYNYDMPQTSTEYIHRVGRTARAGKNGTAISFVSSGEHGELRLIGREATIKIEKQRLPPLIPLKNTIDFRSVVPLFRRGQGTKNKKGHETRNRRK
ncbi:DEAD/DEAH box helicase [Candidatus Pacearchaeota archaeon]|nr:DEAD/DEAH box helicase [Candidatus Pacearchaeota archaeon]